MQNAPSPENKSSRLTKLQQYTVLDTPPETAFDELIALVSLIDAQETSRDIAFILLHPFNRAVT